MRRFAVLPFGLAALLLFSAVGPVAADTHPVPAQSIDLFGCWIFQQGVTAVAANRTTEFRYGWFTKKEKQIRQFLRVATIVVKVDGVKIPDAQQYWQEPYFQDGTGWVVFWRYPAGKLPRNSATMVKLQLKFSAPHYDGYQNFPAGNLLDPPAFCTMTAT